MRTAAPPRHLQEVSLFNASHHGCLVRLDAYTKLFFFLIIVFSNLSFAIYWAIMMYFELKSMLVKKFA